MAIHEGSMVTENGCKCCFIWTLLKQLVRELVREPCITQYSSYSPIQSSQSSIFTVVKGLHFLNYKCWNQQFCLDVKTSCLFLYSEQDLDACSILHCTCIFCSTWSYFCKTCSLNHFIVLLPTSNHEWLHYPVLKVGHLFVPPSFKLLLATPFYKK